jgi:dihydrofolate reductase/thymidylate synthase
VYREALNAPECEAIHVTEIHANIECDTFMPPIDTTIFRPWYSSFPKVENNIRYSFTTYVRVRSSAAEPPSHDSDSLFDNNTASKKFEVKNFSFLPKMIFERHGEYMYLNLVQEIISQGTAKGDRTGTGTLSTFGCQVKLQLVSFGLMQFNLYAYVVCNNSTDEVQSAQKLSSSNNQGVYVAEIVVYDVLIYCVK